MGPVRSRDDGAILPEFDARLGLADVQRSGARPSCAPLRTCVFFDAGRNRTVALVEHRDASRRVLRTAEPRTAPGDFMIELHIRPTIRCASATHAWFRCALAWLPVAVALLTASALQPGCTTSDDDPLSDFGQGCNIGDECGSLMCHDGVCTLGCESNEDCMGASRLLACGVAADGSKLCLPTCSDAAFSYVCENDVPVHCDQASTDACARCGCGEGAYCDYETDLCVPKAEVGEPCDRSDTCASDNCSVFAGLCRVPVGSQCTSTNCDRCLVRTDAPSYCSRECSSESECGDDICVGDPDIDYFHCTSTCDSGVCPGQCEITGNSGTTFCDCREPGCTEVYAEAPLGSQCRFSSMCESSECWSRAEEVYLGYKAVAIGWCTQACASDEDCSNGTACVDVDCNQFDGCTSRCVPRCESEDDCENSWCVALPSASGNESTSVCTMKAPREARCLSDWDCQSANCNSESNRCE